MVISRKIMPIVIIKVIATPPLSVDSKKFIPNIDVEGLPKIRKTAATMIKAIEKY